ncbi:MAG: DNA polymerase, partial [Candidatus Saccharimonadales bacterium]
MKQRPQFAAFDFESEGLGGKALAFSWCLEDGAPHYYTHDNPAVIEDYALQVMLDNPAYRWYAHNAQYDWRYLIPAIRRTKTPTVYLSRTATDIYSIRLNPDSETPCNMVDSMAMWPGSLASMLDTFCPELPKLKIDVTKFDRKDPEHIAYSKRDAEGLVTAMIRFDQTMLEAYGEHIQLTTAGTSMKAWRRTIPDGTQYSPPLKYEEFIRQSYFGGYVIPHNIAAWENCKTYDINSSYPASMRDYEYPNGAATETRKFNEDCLGIYECEVKTPEDCTVPLLGKKEMRNKTDVTNWPRGNFKTVATSPEIKFARDHGYEVKVIRGIFFESVCRPFVDFVKMSQKTRIQNKGTPLEAVCKLMQNSLYGKFGA